MNSKVGGELDQMLEVVVVMLVLVELVMVVMEVVLDKEVGKKVVECSCRCGSVSQ